MKQEIFRFKGFKERISEIKINVVHRVTKTEGVPLDDQDTFFRESLEKWQQLNRTDDFLKFHSEVNPKAGSLNQLIFNKDEIVKLLLTHLNIENSLGLDGILDLVVQLARDLQYDFLPYFEDFFIIFMRFVNSSDPALIENTFVAIAYLFKYLWRSMIKNKEWIYGLYKELLSTAKKAHVVQFAAESFSFLIRRVKDQNALFSLMVQDLTEESASSVGQLVFETIKGVRKHTHSCARDVVSIFLSYVDLKENKYEKLELVHTVLTTVVQQTLKTLNQESIGLFWSLLLSEANKIVKEFEEGEIGEADTKTNKLDCLLELLCEIVSHRAGSKIPSNDVCEVLSSLISIQKTMCLSDAFLGITVSLLQSETDIISNEDKRNLAQKLIQSEISAGSLQTFVKQTTQLASFSSLILPDLLKLIENKFQKCIGSHDAIKDALQLLLVFIAEEIQSIKSPYNYKVDLHLDFDGVVVCKEICQFIVSNLDTTAENTEVLVDALVCLTFIRPLNATLVKESISKCIEVSIREIKESSNIASKLIPVLGQGIKSWVSLSQTLDIPLTDIIEHQDLVEIMRFHANECQYLDAYECYCLQISMMNSRELPLTEMYELYPYLKDNLCSPQPQKYLCALKILKYYWDSSHHDLENEDSVKSHVLKSCIDAASIPATFEKYQERLLYLQKLTYKKGENGTEAEFWQETSLLFLISNLYVNLNLLWEPVMEIISSFFLHDQGIQFWKIWSKVLVEASKHCKCSEFASLEAVEDSSPPQRKSIGVKNQRTDYYNFRLLLFKTMNKFPELVERKSRDVVPLFLDFIREEFHKSDMAAAPTQNITKALPSPVEAVPDLDIDEDEKDHAEKRTDSHPEQRKGALAPRSSSYKRIQTLCQVLKVLSNFKNPKAVYREPQLFNLYKEFLLHRDNEVQKTAFACIRTYKFPYVRPYEENFDRVFDDATFRDELTLLITSEENSIIEKGHRANLIPYIIRILIGKLHRRSGLGVSGKSSQAARRNIVMQFLSLCTTEELETFMNIICEPFKERLKDNESPLDLEKVIPLKKQQEFLSMLAHLFSRLKLGLVPFLARLINILVLVLKDVSTCLSRREEISHGLVSQLKTLRQLGIANLITIYESYVKFSIDSFKSAIFEAAVFPQLSNVQTESFSHQTPLLKLILTWGKHAKYHPLLAVEHPSSHITPIKAVLSLLEHPSLTDDVASYILQFVNNLLDASDATSSGSDVKDATESTESRPHEDHFGRRLIKPNTRLILDYLAKTITQKTVKVKWRTKKARASSGLQLHLSVLSKISEFVHDEAECKTTIKLLLPFAKFSKSEEIVNNTLLTIRNLLKYVTNVEFVFSDVATLLGTVSTRTSRVLLCDVFEVVSKKMDGLNEVRQIVDDINSWDAKRLDEADYDRRLKGYRTLVSMVKDGKFNERQLLPLVNNCTLYLLETDDLSLRDASSNSLAVILETISHWPEKQWHQLIYSCTIPAVRIGIKSKQEATRNCFIQILSQLVKLFPGLPFSDLKKLSSTDLEVDFFQNIRHIQIHRRIRAIHLFTQLCSTEASFSVTAAYDFALPLFGHFLFEKSTAKDHNVVAEAVQALSAIAGILPWQKYCHVLRSYLKVLIRSEDNQKLISRMVVAWLDAFHFDMSVLSDQDIACFNKTVKESEESAPEGDTTDDHVEDNPDSSDEEEGEDEEKDIKSKTLADDVEKAKRILGTIANKILPQLRKFLTRKLERDDQIRQMQSKIIDQAEMVRIPLALTMIKLLQKLPKSFLRAQLSGILLKVCNSLKSRGRDVRDVARDTIVKIAVALGSGYVNVILKDLHGVLRRGYQRHVLSFTVHKMLDTMAATMKPGDLDSSLGRLVEILTEDVFGESAEEKEVRKIADKLFEAKTVKSYDSFEIVGRFVSRDKASQILDPITKILEESQSHKVAHKAEEILRKFGIGLQGNSSISDSDLLIFIFNAAKKNLAAENEQKRAKPDTQAEIMSEDQSDIYVIPEDPGRTGKLPEVNKKTNVHVIVEFSLQLLVTCIKHQRFSKSNDEHLGMLDPFVDLCVECLKSRHIKIIVLSMRIISHLIKYPLPSVGSNIAILTKKMFKILKNYSRTGTGKGDNFELVMTSFKAMTVLIRDYADHQITNSQLQVLLTFVEEDIYDNSKQATAFPMLKAILSRKLENEAISEVMEKVNKLVVTSESPLARQSCRQIALQYLLDYPLGKKIDKILQFFVSNLSYEEEFGRESVLELLAAIFTKFPEQLIQTYAGYFFVPLTLRLVNEESSSCKRLTYHTIKLLLEKVDNEKKDYLFSLVIKWNEDEKISLKKLMCQVVGVFVDAEENAFQRRLPSVLPILSELINAEEYDEDDDEDTTQEISLKDSLLFSALGCLSKICHHCNLVRNLKFSKLTSTLWDSIQVHLLHAHTWVRLVSSQLIGHLFAAWNANDLVKASTRDDKSEDFLARNLVKKIRELSVDICDQLKADTISDDLASQSIKNLVFLGKVINHLEKCKNPEGSVPSNGFEGKSEGDVVIPADDEEKPTTISWLTKKICGLATYEASYTPKDYVKRKAVFQWIAAIALDLGQERLEESLLLSFLRPIHRELNNTLLASDSELRVLSQEVLDLLRGIVGVEDFAEAYAKLQHKVSTKKEAIKRKLAAEAVTHPEKAARRKLKHNLAKREYKKRKLTEKKPLLKVKKLRSEKVS